MNVVEVIMPVYNALPLARRAVLYLLGHTPENLRFIFVDNGSDERLDPILTWLGPQHTVIRNETNLGVYVALNQALREVTSEHVIICCTDHFVMPHWYAPCLAAIKDHGFAWVGPEWKEGALYAREEWNALTPPATFGIRGEFASSCAVLNWKVLKEKVGYFDEQFFLVFGDTDYCERMNDAGLRGCVVDGAKSHHVGNQSRRGVGIATDVDWQIADAMRFRAKWKDRPDVLQRHAGVEGFLPEHRDDIIKNQEALWTALDPGPL